jgi:hypothetical protein
VEDAVDDQQIRKILENFDWRSITPEDSPVTLPEHLADPVVEDLASAKLKLGERAIDFSLPLYDFSDGQERASGETFSLLPTTASRPVALVFGSYT